MLPIHRVICLVSAAFFVVGAAPPAPPPPPSDMGPAAVAPSAPPDPALLARFRDEYLQSVHVPRPVFERYLPTLGATALLDFLEATYPQCHGQSHDLGKAILAREGNLATALATALATCGSRCTAGCMHGVISEAFGREDLALLVERMNGFCADSGMTAYQPGNCAHALGHAFMLITDRSIDESINACLYFEREPMRYYCAEGVFMEAIDGSGAPAGWPTAHAPCDAHSQFPSACYRYRVPRLLAEGRGNLATIAGVCHGLQGAQRRGCYYGLGAALRATPHRLPQVCGSGEPDEQAVCVEGAIEKLADFDLDNTLALCATLPPQMATRCADAARGGMYRLDKPTLALYYVPELVGERRPLAGAPGEAHDHGHHHPTEKPTDPPR